MLCRTLLLDEIAEFDRRTLEAMRQSLETDTVHIRTASENIILPADFILIGAMNPCKCGNFGQSKNKNGSGEKGCTCTALNVRQYQNRLSGPILDRVDIFLQLEKPAGTDVGFRNNSTTETKHTRGSIIKANIHRVRLLQKERLAKLAPEPNIKLGIRTATAQKRLVLLNSIKKDLSLNTELCEILNSASKRLNLSLRAIDSILLVSRTIADIESSAHIKAEHILEALSYRQKSF